MDFERKSMHINACALTGTPETRSFVAKSATKGAAPGEKRDQCSCGLGTSRSKSKKTERVPGEKLRRIRRIDTALKWLPLAP